MIIKLKIKKWLMIVLFICMISVLGYCHVDEMFDLQIEINATKKTIY